MPLRNSATKTVVRVSEQAFIYMCFSAAEAAMIAPDFNSASYNLLANWMKGRGDLPIRKAPMPPSLVFSETGRETSGVGFGDMRRTKNQTIISVEFAMATTAINSDEGSMQSGASSLLLADLCDAARLPSVCACWHSHALLTASPREVAEQELYGPSETDMTGPAYPNSAVSLVVTVAWPDKARSRPADKPGLASRRIGDFNFFLTGHLPGIRNWSSTDPALEIRIGY